MAGINFCLYIIVSLWFTCTLCKQLRRPPDAQKGLFQGDIVSGGFGEFRSAVQSRWSRWYGNKMRYTFLQNDPSIQHIDTSDQEKIRSAITELESMINKDDDDCFKFEEVSDNHEKFPTIVFYAGTGCHSNVGMSGGTQMLSLGRGCIHNGYIWHELLHALGLWHEHTRRDRDQYVTINWANIEPDARGNFEMQPTSKINDLGTPYDLTSLMHYPDNYFSVDGIRKTIVPKTPGVKIGQRNKPSYWDIKRIRLLYECDSE